MRRNLYLVGIRAVVFCAAAACLCTTGLAQVVASGQRTFGQSEVEPMLDDGAGNTVFALETSKTPFPAKANSRATAPLYAVIYPTSSAVPAAELNCQPTNCDHNNVLPFQDADYGLLPGDDPACTDFNGGNPCSPVKGHDHLIGVASTGGDFNVAWHVELVLFTTTGFSDGAINTRITTLNQLQALENNGDVITIDTPITFNCALVSQHVYDLAVPLAVSFP